MFDAYKALIMHAINVAAGVLLALKGKDHMAFMVLGAAYGLASNSWFGRRASDVLQGGGTNPPATRPVATPQKVATALILWLALGTLVAGCNATQKQTLKTDANAVIDCSPEVGIKLAAIYEQCRANASPDDSPWGCVAIAAVQVGPDAYACVKLHIAHQNADGGAAGCPFEKAANLTPTKERR